METAIYVKVKRDWKQESSLDVYFKFYENERSSLH